jgi:hypothetical protein
MNFLRAFFRFWRDFIIGDDWRIAAGLAFGLLVTWLVARAGVPAWWLLPVAVLGVLLLAVWRAVRTDERVSGALPGEDSIDQPHEDLSAGERGRGEVLD